VPSDELHPIALTLDDLREARRVIGVAGGVEKTASVQGAIAAGVLDEVIVDETLALSLLA
jgi:DNA-binding transcriptional regulator LsrR (DeoR family)